MKKKEKLKGNIFSTRDVGMNERRDNDVSNNPINLTPQNYVKCLNDVCCVTECYYKDGELKCYTICFQKGKPNYWWVKNT